MSPCHRGPHHRADFVTEANYTDSREEATSTNDEQYT